MADRALIIDLGVPVRLADLPRLGRGAVSWWLSELSELAPAWLRDRLPRRTEPALLFVNGTAWRLAIKDQSQEIDATADDPTLAGQLRAAIGEKSRRCILVLPHSAVLRRRLELPLIADSHVRSAVELQIDRISPFRVEDVRYAARVVERDAAANKLIADVAIVPRTQVEAIEHRLVAAGLKPTAIDVATMDGERERFDLLAVDASRNGRPDWMITAGLAAAVALMWYLAIYAWGAARARELDAWQSEVAALRPATERSLALQRQLAAIAEPLAIARTHQPGAALGDVLELTQLLGDDVRLIEIKFNGDAIELTGLGADAPALIGKLEASKRFKDVKFRSPVTRRPEMDKDRFEIVMTREGGS